MKEKDIFASESRDKEGINPLLKFTDILRRNAEESGLTLEEYSENVKKISRKEAINILKQHGIDWEKIKRKEE